MHLLFFASLRPKPKVLPQADSSKLGPYQLSHPCTRPLRRGQSALHVAATFGRQSFAKELLVSDPVSNQMGYLWDARPKAL